MVFVHSVFCTWYYYCYFNQHHSPATTRHGRLFLIPVYFTFEIIINEIIIMEITLQNLVLKIWQLEFRFLRIKLDDFKGSILYIHVHALINILLC